MTYTVQSCIMPGLVFFFPDSSCTSPLFTAVHDSSGHTVTLFITVWTSTQLLYSPSLCCCILPSLSSRTCSGRTSCVCGIPEQPAFRYEPHTAKTILYCKNGFFFSNRRLKFFFTAKCCYQLKGTGNALSKEDTVVSVKGNDRNTVWHSSTHSGPRRAIQNANQVHKISSGPLRTTQFSLRL